MRDVGHPIATQYRCRWILGRACGLGVGRKHKGRPARYVRRGAIIGSPTCSNFHSVYMLTLKTCTALSRTPHPAVRAATTSLACKNKPEVNVHGLSMLFPPPTPHLPAGCGYSWRFGAVHASSTLAHKTAGGSFKQVVVPSVQLTMGHWRMSQEAAAVRSPALLLIGTGYLHWVPVMLEHDHP
jgi:hypothetical protein